MSAARPERSSSVKLSAVAARPHVAAQRRPVRQPVRRGTDPLQRQQPGGQHLGRLHALLRVRLVVRQQQAGLQPGQPGRHHQPVGRQLQPHPARALHGGEELLHQAQDGDARQVDLLRPRQVQQQVQRALEPVQLQRERGSGSDIVAGQAQHQVRARGMTVISAAPTGSNAIAELPQRLRQQEHAQQHDDDAGPLHPRPAQRQAGGSTPTTMRPPSSGGIGSRLNRPSTRLARMNGVEELSASRRRQPGSESAGAGTARPARRAGSSSPARRPPPAPCPAAGGGSGRRSPAPAWPSRT